MLRETDPLACHIPSRHQEQNGEQSGTEPGAESVTNTEEHGDEEKGSGIDAKPTGITGNDHIVHQGQQREERNEAEKEEPNRIWPGTRHGATDKGQGLGRHG